MSYLKVPKDRLGVVIGPRGRTRRMIEDRSGIKLEVDTEQNEVHIVDEEGADPIMSLKLQDVVRAIGRGFSPENALRLLRDDTYLELLDIHDYVGKGKTHVHRIKARVIGSEGRTRKLLEEQTGCDISVYGHTVGIIGDVDGIGHAKQAVDMILSGSEHASVYRFLEGVRRAERRAKHGGGV